MEIIDFIEELDRIPRRYIRDKENPLEYYTDGQFRIRFRFTKQTVLESILPLITNRNEPATNRGLPLMPIQKLLIALRFYGTGNFQIVAGDLAGVSQPTVSRIVHEYSNAICQALPQVIKFPSAENGDLRRIKSKFFRIGNFPGVIGAIDCTHIPIQSPCIQTGEIYRNRKGCFSINVQLVSGPNLEIFDIVARWPGSTHGSRIFDNSSLKMRLENGLLKGILLGDSGYSQTLYLFTPVLNPRSDEETRYNRAHIKTRNVVERLNGVWKRRFPCLYRKLAHKLDNILLIISACAVLHNIAIKDNEPDFPPESDFREFDFEDSSSASQHSSRQKRIKDLFIKKYF